MTPEELLKEVGEPVAYFSDEFFSINTKQNATFNDPLFSSDQVAAVVLKVTGPLEHELRELRMSTRMRGEDIDELRAQLAAAQEEIKTVTEQKNRMWFEMQTAQDQLAKAEQRVAEACAALIADEDIAETDSATGVAHVLKAKIKHGEYRKFVKEM